MSVPAFTAVDFFRQLQHLSELKKSGKSSAEEIIALEQQLMQEVAPVLERIRKPDTDLTEDERDEIFLAPNEINALFGEQKSDFEVQMILEAQRLRAAVVRKGYEARFQVWGSVAHVRPPAPVQQAPVIHVVKAPGNRPMPPKPKDEPKKRFYNASLEALRQEKELAGLTWTEVFKQVTQKEVQDLKTAYKKTVSEMRTKKPPVVQDPSVVLLSIIKRLQTKNKMYMNNREPGIAPSFAKKGKMLLGFQMATDTNKIMNAAGDRDQTLTDLLAELNQSGDVLKITADLKQMIENDLVTEREVHGKFSTEEPFRGMLEDSLKAVKKLENNPKFKVENYRKLLEAVRSRMELVDLSRSGLSPNSTEAIVQKLDQTMIALTQASTVEHMQEIHKTLREIRQEYPVFADYHGEPERNKITGTAVITEAMRDLEALFPRPKVPGRSSKPM